MRDIWRLGEIRLLAKNSTNPINAPQVYRVITFLQVMKKLYEKLLIKKVFSHWVIENN